MSHRGLSIIPSLGLAFMMAVACAGDDDIPEGHFSCGLHGGSCDASSEACVVLDGCSTCIILPDDCEEPSCECAQGSMDADPTLSSCIDNGSCSLEEGGVSATCMEAEPFFGCG